MEAFPDDGRLMRLLARNTKVQVESEHVLDVLKVALSTECESFNHEAAVSEDHVAEDVLSDQDHNTESRANDDVSAALVDDVLNVLQLLLEEVDLVGTSLLIDAPDLRVDVVVV